MTRILTAALTLATAALCATLVDAQAPPASLSFFIASRNPGQGANLGGLAGADRLCQELATAAGAGGRQWRAYLSTTGPSGVNARDRIGTGPWYNVRGVKVAESVADLHSDSNRLSKEHSLTEKGDVLNGRGDQPNMHDVLTGSNLDGTASTGTGDTTCANWTSSDGAGSATVGHHDRQGGGTNPTSWNSAHPSKGCSLENLRATGGDGRVYCFAAR